MWQKWLRWCPQFCSQPSKCVMLNNLEVAQWCGNQHDFGRLCPSRISWFYSSTAFQACHIMFLYCLCRQNKVCKSTERREDQIWRKTGLLCLSHWCKRCVLRRSMSSKTERSCIWWSSLFCTWRYRYQKTEIDNDPLKSLISVLAEGHWSRIFVKYLIHPNSAGTWFLFKV